MSSLRPFLTWCLGAGVLVLIYVGYWWPPGPAAARRDEVPALSLGAVRTTAPPRFDIARVMPELAAKAKTTVRLHPRRLVEGESLPQGASKLGGDFLWPEDEPWPSCAMHGLPWVGVIQLRKADFPEVEFKPGSDLLQVLWCPQRGHGFYPNPEPVLVWRDAAKVVRPRKEFPRPRLPTPAEIEDGRRQSALEHDLHWLELFRSNPQYIRMVTRQERGMLRPSSETWLPESFFRMPVATKAQFEALQREALRLADELKKQHHIPRYADDQFLPHPCRFFPERVTEYPNELSAGERERLAGALARASGVARKANDEDDLLDAYFAEMSVADGTKVRGYVRWSQAPEPPLCGRGHPMDHLLTIASAEFDARSLVRWQPLEERKLAKSLRAAGQHKAYGALHRPAGLTLGDEASKHVFVCRRCAEYPVRSIIQD